VHNPSNYQNLAVSIHRDWCAQQSSENADLLRIVALKEMDFYGGCICEDCMRTKAIFIRSFRKMERLVRMKKDLHEQVTGVSYL
jgi:hypothetical protein